MSGLWDEACRLYGALGVRELCLDLQDRHGVDVVVLLTVVWAWRRGIPVDDAVRPQLLARVRGWHEEVVQPLRRARRSLRPEAEPGRAIGLDGTATTALKAKVQALELEAERLQLEGLERLVTAWPKAPVPPLIDLLVPLVPCRIDPARWQPLIAAAEPA